MILSLNFLYDYHSVHGVDCKGIQAYYIASTLKQLKMCQLSSLIFNHK